MKKELICSSSRRILDHYYSLYELTGVYIEHVASEYDEHRVLGDLQMGMYLYKVQSKGTLSHAS